MAVPILPLAPQVVASGGVLGATAAFFADDLKYEKMSIAGLNPVDYSIVMPERAFQFWPETISDTFASGWVEKPIPGASHSLMHWGANSGRTISFEVPLFRNMNYDQIGLGPVREYPANDNNRIWNEDIDVALKYFRSFMYPTKVGGEIGSPMVAVLYMPNSMINENGSNYICGVMTACDITYTKMFNNGRVKMANIALTFKQIVQNKQGEAPNFKFLDVSNVKFSGASSPVAAGAAAVGSALGGGSGGSASEEINIGLNALAERKTKNPLDSGSFLTELAGVHAKPGNIKDDFKP